MSTSVAIFGAGCFWGVEAAFQHLPGVIHTTVGYAGGESQSPTYEEVCSGTTGHAEVVKVEYDPALTQYSELLDTFFKAHDATQRDRQGPDVGTQYRSLILYTDESQRAVAKEAKAAVPNAVTEIEPLSVFYPAEEYHQQYLAKRGQATCGIV